MDFVTLCTHGRGVPVAIYVYRGCSHPLAFPLIRSSGFLIGKPSFLRELLSAWRSCSMASLLSCEDHELCWLCMLTACHQLCYPTILHHPLTNLRTIYAVRSCSRNTHASRDGIVAHEAPLCYSNALFRHCPTTPLGYPFVLRMRTHPISHR